MENDRRTTLDLVTTRSSRFCLILSLRFVDSVAGGGAQVACSEQHSQKHRN